VTADEDASVDEDAIVDRESIADLADEIASADSVVALTGAGVSVASGIPPFRGETPDAGSDDGGEDDRSGTGSGDVTPVWERHDPAEFHRRRFDADPAGWWEDRLALREIMYGDGVEPNAAHEALATLESRGRLDALLTQNVDGLHAAAGSESVVELHGTRTRVVCDDCGDRAPAEAVWDRARDGEVPPTCDCGGVLRPDVVLFGEGLPDGPFERAQVATRRADVFLAIGSSLSVRPVSLLPEIAADAGATLAVCNYESTPVDDRASYVLRADVTEALPALVDAVGEVNAN
jgi:NAD-dependent deacetylase